MLRFSHLIRLLVFAAAAVTAPGAALTNDMVCDMLRGGAAEAAVIESIENSETDFELDAANLQRLHTEKVPRAVIRAMLRKGSGRAATPNSLTPVTQPATRSELVAYDASGTEVVLQRRLQNATFVKSDKTDARAVIADLLLSDAGIALLTAGLSQQMKVWNPYMGETLARVTQFGRGLLAGSKAETRGFEYETLPGATATAAVRPGKLSIVVAAQTLLTAGQATPVLLKLEPREKDGSRLLASRQVVIRQVKQGRFDMSPTVEREEVAVQEAVVPLQIERLPDGSLRLQTKEDLLPGEYALVLRQPGTLGVPTSNVALPVSAAEVATLFSGSGTARSRIAPFSGLGRISMLGRKPNGTDEARNSQSSAFIAWDFRVAQ